MRPLLVPLAAASLVALSAAWSAAPSATTVDTKLCPFPLAVTVTEALTSPPVEALQFTFGGHATITLRNERSGRTAVLRSTDSWVRNATGTVTFHGHRVWFWSSAPKAPYLATDGTGRLVAPGYALSPAPPRAQVIDPCALVAASAPAAAPRTTRGPWGLPSFPLTRIEHAGLLPLVGKLVRHDHVHLDVIVNGRRLTVPAGVGLVEPVDTGPCPPQPGNIPQGDCTTRNFYVAKVAVAPVHTHSRSGLIHVEADRRGRYTLGQFFDVWDVRLDGRCVGGYCAGHGKQLRVYVDGRRFRGDPRDVVLGNRQEIAVVFGGAAAFRAVPTTYRGGWPGLGCGGPHDRFGC